MNRSIKAEYWRVVRACLREFYGRNKGEAETEVRTLRARLAALAHEQESDPFAGEMIYHEEALVVASQIAGRNSRDDWDRYTKLLERMSPSAPDAPVKGSYELAGQERQYRQFTTESVLTR